MKTIKTDFDQETQEWSAKYRGYETTIPVMDIEERLRRVERQLLLVAPAEEMLAKYPALREAYREYKLIERLVLSNDE